MFLESGDKSCGWFLNNLFDFVFVMGGAVFSVKILLVSNDDIFFFLNCNEQFTACRMQKNQGDEWIEVIFNVTFLTFNLVIVVGVMCSVCMTKYRVSI